MRPRRTRDGGKGAEEKEAAGEGDKEKGSDMTEPVREAREKRVGERGREREREKRREREEGRERAACCIKSSAARRREGVQHAAVGCPDTKGNGEGREGG